MKRALYSFIVICWGFGMFTCQAQTSVKVSDPRLEIKGNRLYISYDIMESRPGEKFFVTVIVTGEDGDAIKVSALEGEVGEEITGGRDKQIIWDFEADNIFINAYLTVQVNAKIIPPLIPEQEIVEVPTTDPEPKSLNRTGIILQSVALPGLGLTKVTGNPHWIKGVAGYGCIAGSVVMNRISISTFNSIKDLETDPDVTDAYNKSVRQDNVSEILAYAAIGIWITDIIWTLVGTSSLSRQSQYAYSKGFSLKSDLDPISNVPRVGIIYRF